MAKLVMAAWLITVQMSVRIRPALLSGEIMTRYYRKMEEGEVDTWNNPEWIDLSKYKKISNAGYNTDARPSYYFFMAEKFLFFMKELHPNLPKRSEHLIRLKNGVKKCLSLEKKQLQKSLDKIDKILLEIEEIK